MERLAIFFRRISSDTEMDDVPGAPLDFAPLIVISFFDKNRTLRV